MESLVVRLAADAQSPVYWMVWSSQEQEVIASGELPDVSHLNSLRERAGQRPVTVLVPGSDVLLKHVELPAKANRKALAAIPFMLEEELNADISELFFALGDKVGNAQQVAVVAREKLADWQQWLSDAGLFCERMLPDILALPHHEEGEDTAWSALQLGEELLIRSDAWQGQQGELSWLPMAMSHYAKQLTSPLIVHTYNQIDLSLVEHIHIEDHSQVMPMQQLALGAFASKFNLLQGEYKQKRQRQGHFQQWRVAAVLAVIALSTALIDKGVQLAQLNRENAALKSQIETEFKRAFPETRRIVNVRSQLRQKLSELEQGGAGTSVLVMMASLSEAFSTSNVKPQSLKFDQKRGELRIQAVANNFEALEKFKTQAESKGFEVQQGAINNRDDMVVGSLSIKS